MELILALHLHEPNGICLLLASCSNTQTYNFDETTGNTFFDLADDPASAIIIT